MKLITIIYGAPVDEEIMEALKKAGANKYTKMQNLTGLGGTAEPHLNTSIWPGMNNLITLIVDDEAKNKLLPLLKSLKEEYRRVGLKAYVSPLEEVI